MTLCFEVFLVWLLLSRVRRLEFYWHPLWKKLFVFLSSINSFELDCVVLSMKCIFDTSTQVRQV